MKIPEPILKLKDLIKTFKGKLYIFGETLIDLHFNNQSPLYYHLISNIEENDLSKILNINLNIENKSCIIFYENDQFHILKKDLLKENLKYPIYIELNYKIKDIKNYLKNTITLNQLAWDFNKFYNKKIFDNYFISKNLKIPKTEISIFKNNIILLQKYIRYIVKYNLTNSPSISPSKNTSLKSYKNINWKIELIKTLTYKKPSLILEKLREEKILNYFLPELIEGYKVEQNEHHKYDVYYHSLSSCDASKKEEILIRLSSLLHDIGKPRSKKQIEKSKQKKNVFYNHENIGARMSYKILKRFNFQNQTCNKIKELVSMHMFHYTPNWTDNAIRRFTKKTKNNLESLLKLRQADRIGSGKRLGYSGAIQELETRIEKIKKQDQKPKVTDLKINGIDLMTNFKLKPGPSIGKILKYLLNHTIKNPKLNYKESLLTLAKNFIKSNIK